MTRIEKFQGKEFIHTEQQEKIALIFLQSTSMKDVAFLKYLYIRS